MSAIDEMTSVDEMIVDAFSSSAATTIDDQTARAEAEILRQNRRAAAVAPDALAAFLDLLADADGEYLAAGEYAPAKPEPELDWDAVAAALGESQSILVGVQALLSETLAAMGIEDHAFVRVFRDIHGDLRLVSAHPRQTEIEAELNSPANADLRELYDAATAGMGLAGALVGTMSLPEEILERVKRRAAFAA